MENEKATVYFTTIVALGIIFLGVIISLFHWDVAIPIIILGIFFTVLLLLLAKKEKLAHNMETLEKVFFFITFFVICISFILLYRPI